MRRSPLAAARRLRRLPPLGRGPSRPSPRLTAGWMAKVKLTSPEELDGLMDEAAYKAFCDE